jgi:hypothetical protein
MPQRKSSKPGLYANTQAKRRRIAHGSGERMREPDDPGAPTAQAFRDAAKTAKAGGKAKAGARKKSS